MLRRNNETEEYDRIYRHLSSICVLHEVRDACDRYKVKWWTELEGWIHHRWVKPEELQENNEPADAVSWYPELTHTHDEHHFSAMTELTWLPIYIMLRHTGRVDLWPRVEWAVRHVAVCWHDLRPTRLPTCCDTIKGQASLLNCWEGQAAHWKH